MNMQMQAQVKPTSVSPSFTSARTSLMQRKCACGGSAGLYGKCEECQRKKLLSQPLQTKLSINEPGDQYEQEADRVTEQVMKMPAPVVQSFAALRPQVLPIQRTGLDPEKELARKEDDDEEDGIVRRNQGSAALCDGQISGAAPPIVHDVLRSPGVALDLDTCAYMEPRFGHDFSRVRVHSGAEAEQSAREVNAHAYTVGQNIVFDAGRFAPGTQEGRRLIAHELAHVVQQSGTEEMSAGQNNEKRGLYPTSHSQWQRVLNITIPQPSQFERGRIQRKRSGKNLSIVKIIAFQGQLDNAQAQLSDGKQFEPIELTSNSLAPGTYTLEFDDNQPTKYRLRDTDIPGELRDTDIPGGFLWNFKSVFEGDFAYAENVSVVILEGDPSTLQEQMYDLPPHIQKFLTSDEGRFTSYEDLQSAVNAGNILKSAGVTEDELLLLEHRRNEAEIFGEPLAEWDPMDWSIDFEDKRQKSAEQALKNRSELVSAIARLENISDKDKDIIKKPLFFLFSDIDEILMKYDNLSVAPLIAAFERELSSFTETFLSQAFVALLRIEEMYLAKDKEQLRQAIEKIRPEVAQYDAAVEELNSRNVNTTLWGSMIIKSKPFDVSPYPGSWEAERDVIELYVREAEKNVREKKEELQKQMNAAGLEDAGFQTFDLDVIRSTNIETSLNKLRFFVESSRIKLRKAEQITQDVKNIYKADRLVEFTKESIGIKQGSLMDDIISARVRQATSDDGFWETVWPVVSSALMLVPGNFGIILKVLTVAGDAKFAMDEYDKYSTGWIMSEAGLADAPSSVGFFLAVGGTLIDAQQMAKGIFEVVGREASAGAHLGSPPPMSVESTVVGQTENAAVNVNDAKLVDDIRGDTDLFDQGIIMIRGEAPVPRDIVVARQEEATLIKRKAEMEKETLDAGHTIDRLEEQLERIRDKAPKDRVADLEKQLQRALDNEKAEAERIAKIEQELVNVQEEIKEIEKHLPKVTPPMATKPESIGELNVDEPTRYRGTRMQSWFKDVFVGKNKNSFRPNLQKILKNDEQGDLSKALLKGENNTLVPANVGKADYWKAHPEIIEAGHARSAQVGDKDVLVVMSKWRNQAKFRADLEGTGDILLDEAYVIQDIAVDRGTAWDLVDAGLLDKSVVERAPVIKLAR